ncbi:MAG: hypothetical protein Q4C88_00365 [Akkermansia sp.]|nr:hypothetical protein [Akkermansia sp.]
MKTILMMAACLSVAPLYCQAAVSPASLEGRTVVLNYTQAEFQTEVMESPATRWVHYSKVHGSAAEEAFGYGTTLLPKATRILTPIKRGGIYSYQKNGAETGVINVDMYKSKGVDVGRVVYLTFLTPTSGVATEEIGHGDYTGRVRNITFTVK